MSISHRALTLVAAALLAVALAAGCSSSSKSSDSNTTTTAANKGFDIATPAGQVSLSLNGNLPPNWPSGFPVPTDATAAGSGSVANSNSDVMVGVYTTTGTPSSAFNFYTTSSAIDPKNPKKVGIGAAFIGTVPFTGTYTGSVTIAGRNSKTYLVIVLKDSGTTTTGASSTTSGASSTTAASG
jgi:hypothetical protein